MTQLLPIGISDPEALQALPQCGSEIYVARAFSNVRCGISRCSVYRIGVFLGQADGSSHKPELRRRWEQARLRQVAIYLTVTEFDIRQVAVSRLLDMSRFNILYACRAIEDLRDDMEFDEALDDLGVIVRADFNMNGACYE